VNGAVEIANIGEGRVGEVVLLEVPLAAFDVVEFGGVFGQPLDGQSWPFSQGFVRDLGGVDRAVVEDDDQRPGSRGGSVDIADAVEQRDEVGGAL